MGIPLEAPVKSVGRQKVAHLRDNQPSQPLKRNERLVYEALRRSEAPLKAYDILEDLQDQGLKAPMTIYRALEALIARSYVKKIESLNAFVAVDYDPTRQASAFLICRKCAKAREIKLNEREVAALFAPTGVSLSDVRIEAFGECAQVCDQKRHLTPVK